MAHLLCLGLLSRYAHEVKVMGDTIDLASDISDRYRRNDERLDKVQSELVALRVKAARGVCRGSAALSETPRVEPPALGICQSGGWPVGLNRQRW